ncbi:MULTISPECIES: hypothetical protein [unclassified Streptomyces]|uniref:hypothetical protein n=1 Tax=unclassified Streptomyces TaxID=2593676 RepID=UPI0036EF052F
MIVAESGHAFASPDGAAAKGPYVFVMRARGSRIIESRDHIHPVRTCTARGHPDQLPAALRKG